MNPPCLELTFRAFLLRQLKENARITAGYFYFQVYFFYIGEIEQIQKAGGELDEYTGAKNNNQGCYI
jgi:hypothetical protein